MIFIASGADASANNLGKISIKAIGDIQADTVTKLNYFGKTWTDDQKIALDDFMVAFNASAWKSKVKVMYMPILMPIQNNLKESAITADGRFKKNIANWGVDLTLGSIGLLNTGYAALGVSQNGIVLQNDSGTGVISTNAGFSINPTSFGITNKAIHYGVYYKANACFRAGSASVSEAIIGFSGTYNVSFYNNISASIPAGTTPKKELIILNGDVTVPTSKTYHKNGLIASNIINTQASAVQSNASVILGGAAGNNTHNDSTSCFMTFGDYMTDAELLEYGTLINALMASLIV